MDVGQRIRHYRKKQGITQEKLSEIAEMDSNHISRIERGEIIPALETLIKLCNGLKVTPNDLLLFEYNSPQEMLHSELADVVKNFSEEDYRKLLEYAYFIRQK